MISDSSVGFERLEIERGFVEFGEKGGVGGEATLIHPSLTLHETC